MRILCCTDYYYPNKGGVEIAAAELYRRLAEKGHNITVLTMGNGKSNHEGIEVINASKVDLTRYLGLQSSISLNFISIFRSVVDSEEYDLLHLHNRFFFTSTVAALLQRWVDIPIVFSLHTTSISNYSGITANAACLYEKTICEYSVSASDHIICNSKSTANKARALGIEERDISVCYHGVDTDTFSPRNRDEALAILYVGRLVKNKGAPILEDIFRNVKEHIPEARLKIVGDGPLKSEMASALSDFNDTVTFYGELPHKKVAKIYQECSIFCLPSKSEGLSLTTLEAMASGLPVVVSDVGGLREIVQNDSTGYKVSPSQYLDFSEKIIELWESDRRMEIIGKRAREYVIDNHSWDKRSDEVERIFKSVVNKEQSW